MCVLPYTFPHSAPVTQDPLPLPDAWLARFSTSGDPLLREGPSSPPGRSEP